MKKDEDDNGCCTRVGNEELMTRDIVKQWVDNKGQNNKGGKKKNMEWNGSKGG